MTLTYNENDREHFGIVQTLGHLLGRIDAGVVHRNDQSHSYYKGIELLKLYPGSKGRGQYFLKADCTGAGQTAHGRSRNRVVVKMGQDNRPVAGEGPLGLVALGPLVEDGVEEGLDAGEVAGEVGKLRREHFDRVRDDAAPRRVAARDDVAQLLDLRAHGGLHERRVDDAEAARERQA